MSPAWPWNDDFAVVHGVPATILRIPMNDDSRAVHESAKVIARSAIYLNLDRLPQVGANVPLTVNVPDYHLLRVTNHCVSQPRVEFAVWDVAGIDLQN